MNYTVCEWDSDLNRQVEREMMPEERLQYDADVAAALAASFTKFLKQVDADTDAIYADAIGNRAPEYDKAAADSAAFMAANYAGDAPASVQCWATAKGWTAQQAADDILAAAARLGSARDAIRANRLQRKEDARNATTQDQLDAAVTAWGAFVATVRAQLGV